MVGERAAFPLSGDFCKMDGCLLSSPLDSIHSLCLWLAITCPQLNAGLASEIRVPVKYLCIE